MQLGPQGSPRPDVYTIEKSFVRPCPMAYECKISVSDFRADVTVGKWSSYLDYAYAVVFAAPAGLISKSDVPDMCGLIVRHENAWRMAKKPTVNPHPIAQEALLKLLIDGVTREGPRVRAKQWNDSRGTMEFARKFGSTAARYVCDAASIQRELKSAEAHRERIIEQANLEAKAIRERIHAQVPAKWIELTACLGLEPSASEWQVRDAIEKVKRERDGGAEKIALKQILASLQRTVRNHEHFISGGEA